MRINDISSLQYIAIQLTKEKRFWSIIKRTLNYIVHLK